MIDLHGYLRHGATCALQAVRDNAPDDPLCTCGLREAFEATTSPEPARSGALPNAMCETCGGRGNADCAGGCHGWGVVPPHPIAVCPECAPATPTSPEPDTEPLPEGACGVMGLCEEPKGHAGSHFTSVERAARLNPSDGPDSKPDTDERERVDRAHDCPAKPVALAVYAGVPGGRPADDDAELLRRVALWLDNIDAATNAEFEKAGSDHRVASTIQDELRRISFTLGSGADEGLTDALADARHEVKRSIGRAKTLGDEQLVAWLESGRDDIDRAAALADSTNREAR